MHQFEKHRFSSSRNAVVFVQYIEVMCQVENEDVVGATPTGDAPTTSEWSTILLPTEVRLELEVWWYIQINSLWPSDAIWCQASWSTLAQVMACHLFVDKTLSKLMLTYWIGLIETNGKFSEVQINLPNCAFNKMDWEMLSARCWPCCSDLNV